jgi:hypothetical protein
MPIPRGLKVTEFKQGDRVRVMGFEARVDYASSGQADAAFILHRPMSVVRSGYDEAQARVLNG